MDNRIPEHIRNEAKKELARRNLYDYCKLRHPNFYKDNRTYLKSICDEIQHFVNEDKEHKFLVLNVPPRHGKSFTSTNTCEWLFGNNNQLKIITGSYNETLSTLFAKKVRDTIWELKVDDNRLVYNDVFPNTRIKYGESSANMWALEGNNQKNYLATSPKGTATGLGANILIIDDCIKNAEEAYNERVLESIWEWFNNTMMSRLEGDWKVIIIMTRWASGDLAGRVIDEFGDLVKVIRFKALQDDGSMLCDEILSRQDYDIKTKNMNKDIIEANYQQEPIDIKGRLYTKIMTYEYEKVPKFKYIMNYTDTADMGDDYLCSIDYGVSFNNQKYVIDVLFSKEPMEVTEPAQAQMMTKDHVGYSKIESNNGGRGYARNVQKELRALKNLHTRVDWFHQSENKQARILSNSTGVMNNVFFPVDWETRFPEFAKAIKKYQREGKNEHDDAPDCLTGVYETDRPNGWEISDRRVLG